MPLSRSRSAPGRPSSKSERKLTAKRSDGPKDSWIRGLLAKLPWRQLAAAGVVLGCMGLGLAYGVWRNLCEAESCPSVAQVRTFEHEQTSKILDRTGRQFAEIGFRPRDPVSLGALPPSSAGATIPAIPASSTTRESSCANAMRSYVTQAVIAVEDKRFCNHGGFDLRGIARAAIGQLTGRNLGGGSTITQQLARNLFDEIGFERIYIRKLKEIQISLELEQAYSKDEIVEAYLNEIYMGRGFGFQNASRSYFGKNIADVNVAEAALLAAILNRPGHYDPFRYPERAKSRRDMVLDLMARQGFLSRDEAETWKAFPLPEIESEGPPRSMAPYFEEWVRDIIQDRFGSDIYRVGMRVYTTLDFDMQRAAREALDEGLLRVESDSSAFRHPRYAEFDSVESFTGSSTPYLQGAFVALDPKTGHVLAIVGGRDFEQSKFDRVRLARRQAGSSFKPFVYTAAVASGIPASRIVVDAPVVYPQVSGEDWRPSNFGGKFKGPMTLREGLYTSTNMIAIKLGWEEVGIETVAQITRSMGIRTEIERFPSTTIGAAEVIPLQMAEAYSAFPNMGSKVRPFPILKVEDSEGNVLWQPEPERTQVLDSLVARAMVSMLEDVVALGTAHTGIRIIAGLPATITAAGKTGTTNDGTDVWFMGFTPNLLAGVWLGMDNPVPIFQLGSDVRQATGGGLAAPIWGSFMKRVYQGRPADPDEGIPAVAPLLDIPGTWPMPEGLQPIRVDRTTGLLASKWCDAENSYVELFIPGTEPTEFCDQTARRFRVPGRPSR